MTNTITPEEIKDAKAIYDSGNKSFVDKHGKLLSEVIPSIPGVKLMKTPTAAERKKERTNLEKQFKLSVENQLQYENRDVYAVYGTRQSLSKHDKIRRFQYFEDRRDAEETSKTRKKRQTSSENFDFDRDGLLNFVNNLSDGDNLNLTELARMFQVPDNQNQGNKIVKDFLLRRKIDLNRFKTKCDKTPRVRPKEKTISKDIKVTMPKPRASKKLREGLREEIRCGKIKLGRLIDPKTYTKVTLDKDGNIKTEEFEVSGRKIPLRDVRNDLNEEHSRQGLMRKDAVIHRYLSVWADHSTLLSHGYLVLTVQPIWSPTTYLTDKEFFEITGKHINVQEVVEKPRLYIFAKSQDSILEKLGYVQTRVEDVKELKWPTIFNDQVVFDHLRMFKGDHPEIQYEAGNSQGGHFPCLCGLEKSKFNDLETVLRSEIIDLNSRKDIITAGPCGRQQKACPFEDLSKEEVLDELRSRDPPGWQEFNLADDLRKFLKKTLRGVNRLPALLYGGLLDILDIIDFEVCPVEVLHDIKGHVVNLWDVLPLYLDDEQKSILSIALKACFNNKDKVRGCDYRFSAIVVYLQLRDRLSQSLLQVLETLVLIIKFAYLPASKRTARTILLTYNVAFRHALSVMNVLGKDAKGKKVSNEKLYGIYSHSIFAHFPSVNRIIPLSSVHCESEERLFSQAKNISLNTSDRKLNHVRDNSIVRLQAEAQVKEATSQVVNTDWQSKISKFDKAVGPIENTRIYPGLCTKRELQAHLERISDYLLPGEGVWWYECPETGDYIYRDGDGEPEFHDEGPVLKSFESESLKSSQQYLKDCWKECINSDVRLPIEKVYVYSESGDYEQSKCYPKNDYSPPTMTDDEDDDQADIEIDVETAAEPLFPVMPTTSDRVSPSTLESNDLFFQYKDNNNIGSPLGKAILRVIGSSKALEEFDTNYRLSGVCPEEAKYSQQCDRYRNVLGKT